MKTWLFYFLAIMVVVPVAFVVSLGLFVLCLMIGNYPLNSITMFILAGVAIGVTIILRGAK